MLDIGMEKVDGVLHIVLEGRLNTLTSKVFAQQVEPELEDARGIVIDMANLEYISSAGLRVLLVLQQHMEEVDGEDVCVRNASQTVLDTLAITGFSGIVNIE